MVNLETLLDRAVEAPAGFVPVVATDADGTLWDGDIGDELFRHLGQRRAFSPVALAGLRTEAAAWLPTVPEDPLALAEDLLACYAAGDIPIGPMCAMEAQALGDRTRDELMALLVTVGADMATRLRPEARTLLVGARARGLGIHVVSGSLGASVEAVLRVAGLPFDTVSGARLVHQHGRVLPLLDGAIPLFEGKVRALAAVGAWPAALGMGDGGWDVTFLSAAHVPVLMHPKAALVASMAGHPRAVTVA